MGGGKVNEVVIAVSALVLSIASLIWQALTWKWSGPRASFDWYFHDVGRRTDEGIETEASDLVITVRNGGRSAMQVTSIELRAETFGFNPFACRIAGPELPFVVQPGFAEVVRFDACRIAGRLAGHDHVPASMKCVVVLGHGREMTAKGRLEFTEELASLSSEEVTHRVVPNRQRRD